MTNVMLDSGDDMLHIQSRRGGPTRTVCGKRLINPGIVGLHTDLDPSNPLILAPYACPLCWLKCSETADATLTAILSDCELTTKLLLKALAIPEHQEFIIKKLEQKGAARRARSSIGS